MVDHLQQSEPMVQAVLLEAVMELLVLHQDVAPHVGSGALVALDGGEGLVGGAVEEVLPDRSGVCLLYTSPSPRDRYGSRMPSSA